MQWESRQGNYLLQSFSAKADKEITEDDARKIFKFLDYNEARVVSKHQIRLLITYHKDVNERKGNNDVLRRLMKMLSVPDLKVFDENLFAFFFTNKCPDRALESY